MPPLFALPPPQPGIEIVLSRPGMSQGLAQTQGPQILARAFVDVGRVRIGLMARNVDSPTASGVAALYGRVGKSIGKIEVELSAMYRLRTGKNGAPDQGSVELSFGARRSFGKAGVRLNADFSLDEFGAGPSLWVEGGPTLALDAKTRAAIVVGRRERSGAPDYSAVSLGVARTVRSGLALEARYHTTDRPALGFRYRGRLALIARLTM